MIRRLRDGRRVELWIGGNQAGPAIVFMHGSPDTRHAAFPGAAAALRAGVRLVVINRPGYGRSDPAESGHASGGSRGVARGRTRTPSAPGSGRPHG